MRPEIAPDLVDRHLSRMVRGDQDAIYADGLAMR